MMTYTILTTSSGSMTVKIEATDCEFDAMCRIEEAIIAALEDVKSEVDR